MASFPLRLVWRLSCIPQTPRGPYQKSNVCCPLTCFLSPRCAPVIFTSYGSRRCCRCCLAFRMALPLPGSLFTLPLFFLGCGACTPQTVAPPPLIPTPTGSQESNACQMAPNGPAHLKPLSTYELMKRTAAAPPTPPTSRTAFPAFPVNSPFSHHVRARAETTRRKF